MRQPALLVSVSYSLSGFEVEQLVNVGDCGFAMGCDNENTVLGAQSCNGLRLGHLTVRIEVGVWLVEYDA